MHPASIAQEGRRWMGKLLSIVILSFGLMAGAQAFTTLKHHIDPGTIPVSSGGSGKGTTTAAPEIDPATAMGGLTLLVGGLAVLRDRRKNKK
jgi:hypothetical protein